MVKNFALFIITISLVFTLLLWWLFHIDFLYSWLIVTNLIAFLTYGYDKLIAGSRKTRVPEKVLLLLALMGGSLGALVGMYVFHHKTSKQSFLTRFWIIFGVQMILVIVYFIWLKP